MAERRMIRSQNGITLEEMIDNTDWPKFIKYEIQSNIEFRKSLRAAFGRLRNHGVLNVDIQITISDLFWRMRCAGR